MRPWGGCDPGPIPGSPTMITPIGLSYNGSMYASGACGPGSTPGSPTTKWACSIVVVHRIRIAETGIRFPSGPLKGLRPCKRHKIGAKN